MTDRPNLETVLADAVSMLLARPVHLSGFRQLAGGASKEIWRLDATILGEPNSESRRLVLVRQLGGKIKSDALDLPEEYQTLACAYTAGVPTPEPLLLLPDLLGRPAALVAWLEGESIGRRIVREPALAAARERLPGQLGAALATIHQIDPLALGAALPGPVNGQSPAQAAIAQIEADLDRIGEPHPAIELGLRWLRRHEPAPPRRLSVLHGDFRVGNIMVAPEGLAGILDWEFAHLGDPYEDLAWPLVRDWRFGNDALRFGGIASPEPFFAAYSAAGGFAPDPTIVHYWEIIGNLRWAVGCLSQADRHLSGQEPNLEFASLGRRCAEMELEALRLIQAS